MPRTYITNAEGETISWVAYPNNWTKSKFTLNEVNLTRNLYPIPSPAPKLDNTFENIYKVLPATLRRVADAPMLITVNNVPMLAEGVLWYSDVKVEYVYGRSVDNIGSPLSMYRPLNSYLIEHGALITRPHLKEAEYRCLTGSIRVPKSLKEISNIICQFRTLVR